MRRHGQPAGLGRRAVGSVALVLACCWLLLACSGPAPSDPVNPDSSARPVVPIPDVRASGITEPPPGQGISRYESQPLTWQPCRNGLECATVLAPVNYDDPDGSALSLAVARRPATARPRLGTLFLNPGGPGGSGVGFVQSFAGRGLEGFDQVGWDPRGVGESTPVRCVGGRQMATYVSLDVSPDDADERQELLDESRDFGRSCLERSGVLLEHVSTLETVRDLELLRVVLRQPTISFLGLSYGTLIGSLYAERYPTRVSRMVLDGAVDLSGKSSVDQVQGFERALRAYARWCARQRCALGATETEVTTAVVALWRRLDERPIRVGSRRLDQSAGVSAVIFALYFDERSWPALTASLQAARDGDGSRLLNLADTFAERDRSGEYGQLNYAFPAVRCRDSADVAVVQAEQRATEGAAKAPLLGPFFGADVICPLWPVPPGPRWATPVAAKAPPIVVIGSTGDSATPYEWAQEMAGQLRTAVLVTRRGDGHTAYGASRCIQELVRDYLVAGRVPKDGTVCVR